MANQLRCMGQIEVNIIKLILILNCYLLLVSFTTAWYSIKRLLTFLSRHQQYWLCHSAVIMGIFVVCSSP